MMTKHLLLLSATRDTPACCLAGLSETVAPLLGIPSVLALGFKVTIILFSYHDDKTNEAVSHLN